jgi:hypothetical protein
MRDIEALKLIMWAAMIVKLSETNNIEISVTWGKSFCLQICAEILNLRSPLVGEI